MLRAGVDREAAENLLAANDYHLRPILGDPPAMTDQ
jgi:hypothetical protein